MTMTTKAPQSSPPEQPTSNKRTFKRILAGGGIALVIMVLGAAWWLGLLTPEPEAVSLASTVQTVQAEADENAPVETEPVQADPAEATVAEDSNEAATSTTQDAPDDVAEPVQASQVDAGIDGTWTIVASDATFAGYRADSQVGEAVGRTPGVNGSLEVAGDQITAVAVTVDMTQLTSDSSLRDEHLGDEGIEYNIYPTSDFVLTEPILVDTIPAEGVAVAFQALGDLTVRDITLPVVINLEATLVGDQLVVAGSTDISLDDYGASVSSTDTAVMEFSLVFSQ